MAVATGRVLDEAVRRLARMSDYSDLVLPPDAVLVGGMLESDPDFAERRGPAEVDPEHFKQAMRSLPTGVVIVTVEVDGRLWGLTINSCCSISTRPPTVLVSLAHQASCRSALLETGRFGLSVLAEEHRELAELGAVPGGPKFLDVFSERAGSTGPATIAGALACLDCSVEQTFEVGDHTLVVGLVRAALVRAQARSGEEGAEPGEGLGGSVSARPLLYFDRAFHRLGARLGGGG